ncbi:MAG: alpha-2-macroglobulin family protein, partial [Azoarcus sp.]|nr:alpha-2-macroglobulin family protein [Azoarcus sp.]
GKLKFGGEAPPPPPPKNQLQKVRLIDIFSGPVALDNSGAAEITLDMPDFNGTLRLMAVAAAPESFGNAESEVIVAAPLVAELATPRFLNVGDSAVLALDLHNLSGQPQKLRVEVLNEGGLHIVDAKRQVSLKDQEKITLRFPVEAGSAFGLVPVEVKVSGDATLSREFALQVQAPTPARQLLRRYVLAPGAGADVREPEMSSLVPSTVNTHLGFSRTPPLDVKSAIQGLLMYPYGCVEQTTSSAYPHVFVDEETARVFGLKPFTREQRVQMLDKAIASLAARQAPVGGFSLWGGSGNYEYWLSAYVSNFLLDAREQGFVVPETTHKKAMDFLLKGLQEGAAGLPNAMIAYTEDSIWRDTYYAGSGRFTVLAYGAYVLAREGKAPLSTLRQMYDLRAQAHSSLALVHLGLALSMMGDEQRASTAIRESFDKTRLPGYWWGDYGSNLRDASLAYALLNRHNRHDSGKENLIAVIAADLDRRGKHVYTSTQEKLALFLAGRQMVVKDPNAKDWQATLQGQTLTQNGPLVRPLNRLDVLGSKTIKVSNPGSENLYLELVTEGFLAKAPPARSDVMKLSRAIFDAEGNPIQDRPFRVGESVFVRVSVAPTNWNTRNALVVDKIPAGLEIENLNIVQGESMATIKVENVEPAQAMQDSNIQHVEFRDDRFATALYLNKPMQLFYRARVVTPGRFIWPQTYAEDMYMPSLYGLADNAKTVTVVDDKSK